MQITGRVAGPCICEVHEEFSVIKEIGWTVVRPSLLACQPVVFIWFLDKVNGSILRAGVPAGPD